MIRLIDTEIILATRREERQDQANRKQRRRRQVWTREWLNRRTMFGQYETLLQELNREAVWDRVYPYYTVSAMYDSYLNRIGLMAIVWSRVCIRVNRTVIVWHSGVNRVLDVGVGDGLERFHTIYIRSWHGWAHSLNGRSRTVSHGLLRSCTVAYTIIHGHDIRASFFKVLKIIHGSHGYTRMARVKLG